VTIIGVILSVAMVTAVTAFIASLQNNIIQSEIAASGGWHVKFTDVDSAFIEKITAGKEVKTLAVTRSVGYALLEENQNPAKPYLFITAFDDGALSAMPIKLIEGRTPQNSGEILIPEHIEISGSVSYEAGETLELLLGKRMINGRSVDQNTSFQNGSVKETFMPNTAKAYTIVGIYQRPGFEGYSAPGYTAITKIDDLGGSAGYDALVTLKSPGQVYDYAEKTAGNVSYEYNRSLLRLYGVSTNDGYNAVLYSLGGILIALIMVGSILLIYNSFAISISERSRQFGILSSVGATKKQLRKSVLFEGVCIGAIGIPLGIAAGVGGIGVTLRLISWITKSMFSNEIPLTLSLSWPALAVAAAVGAATILISAYIPARRAFRKSAIDTIRQSGDIKIKAKEIKTSKLVGMLFGLEGTLALKNFKRNKKRYRSTVISLFVSVVLFTAASAFGMYLKQGTEMTVGNYGFDIAFGASQGS
jgi:putative ABC transport system permease protein